MNVRQRRLPARVVLAVRAALPSPRPQGWQALQFAAGLAEHVPTTLIGDAGRPDGGPATLERWLGRPLPAALTPVVPSRPSRPPLAGVLFRRALARAASPDAVLVCRDPRVAAAQPRRRWSHVVMEWHVRPEPGYGALTRPDLHVTVARGLADDLRACGADTDVVRDGTPGQPIELMVAYLYDLIARGNPVGLFGMVNVLEGTSIALATHAAGSIQQRLDLPSTAFSYLSSHGSLDVGHMETYRKLMDRLDDPQDQAAVIRASKMVYALYTDMFRQLPAALAEPEKESAHASV